MADSITINLEGIEGDSGVQEAALNVMNWSWGMSNDAQLRSEGGFSVRTAHVNDIQFQKQFCKASPIIMKYLTTGQHFKKATLEMRKSTGKEKPQVFLKVDLTNVFISNYRTEAGSGSDEITEAVTLVFETVNVVYQPQDTTGGSLEAAIEFTHDRSSEMTHL